MIVFYLIPLTDARFLCVIVVPWFPRCVLFLEVLCPIPMFFVRLFRLVVGL